MNSFRASCLLSCLLILVSSCANYKKLESIKAVTAEEIFSERYRSKNKDFAYYVHYKNDTYPITNVKLSYQNDSSFISGTLANSNINYTKAHDQMKYNEKISVDYQPYVNQVHYTLKDQDSSLFSSSSTLIDHLVIHTEIYHKPSPSGLAYTGYAFLGIVGLGLLVGYLVTFSTLSWNWP